MGRFFSAIHVKNNKKDREQLLKAFSAAMKKRGLAECTEDEASITYLLAFSEHDKWVTLTAPDYESDGKKVSDDTRELAKELKTSCLSISVVDSDFAIIELYGETTDTVIVGDGSGYGFEEQPRGKKECWAHLLSGNTVWEQLSEIWSKEYVFAEDLLCETAPLLGIDAKNMVSDYEDFSGETDSDANVIALYFKNAEKKSMSLNTAFKKVFGEALEPLGFKKIKGKQPYFVKVVDDEIIHAITICNEKNCLIMKNGIKYKSYDILCGITTIYAKEIDFNATNWMKSISEIYTDMHPFDCDMKFRASIMNFSYNPYDSDEIINSLNNTLDLTKQIVLPIINEVASLDLCMDFFDKLNMIPLYPRLNNTQSLLYIKLDTFESFYKRLEAHIERELCKEENFCQKRYGSLTKGFIDYRRDVEEKRDERRKMAYQLFNDPELQAEALVELECIKAQNTEILRSYGLDL